MNHWDTLSEKFNARQAPDQIDADVADNVLIAWPPIISLIVQKFKNKKDARVLDFGCGAGDFCEKLYSLGFKNVTGVDSSTAMIRIAQKKYGDHINFSVGSKINAPVDVIVSVMALQFVKDIHVTLQNLAESLASTGMLVFAVHNPAKVAAVLKIQGKLFSNFQSTEKPEQGLINMGGHSIPVYIRTAQEYDELVNSFGLTKVFEKYPPFTKEFLENYITEVPEVSNFLILGYAK